MPEYKLKIELNLTDHDDPSVRRKVQKNLRQLERFFKTLNLVPSSVRLTKFGSPDNILERKATAAKE